MTTTSIAFNQFIRLPFLGEAWVERDRSQDSPFFAFDVERGGQEGASTGPVSGFTLRAGRWTVIVDRPVTSRDAGPGSTVAWIALGAPLVTLVGIAACLLASPVRHALASLQRAVGGDAGRPIA